MTSKGPALDLTCPNCKHAFALSEVLREQIETNLRTQQSAEHRAELEAARAEATEKANVAAQEQFSLELQVARDDAAEGRRANNELRAQVRDAMKELREMTRQREQESLEIDRQREADRSAIRDEERVRAAEAQSLKVLELQTQLAQTRQALDVAQRRSEQGSQQIQGQALELLIEQELLRQFPQDEISKTKSGQRGADFRQCVRSSIGSTAGTIVWETKNAQWQPAWVKKLGADLRADRADFGVLVSANLPASMGPITHLGGTVWAAQPDAALALGLALRESLLRVHEVSGLYASEDERLRHLLAYVTGPEFQHRVHTLFDGFTAVQQEVERQKRYMTKSWETQEQTLRSMIDSVGRLDGAFSSLAALPPSEETPSLPGGSAELVVVDGDGEGDEDDPDASYGPDCPGPKVA